MKNIFYCSSVQKDIFSDNARSKFKNYIDIDNLRYLPKGPIEVAVKRIMFDSSDIDSSQGTLALKSDLCRESAYNGKYEKILCTFQVRDTHHVEFNSPTYFSTKIELLSNVKFTIINLKTGEQPNWESGAPTFIQLQVRRKMSNTFNIFLSSNDVSSKLKYPENNNMEFTINLPERYRLGKWKVCLKSLIIPSKIFNVYKEKELTWCFQMVSGGVVKNEIEWQKLKPGFYDIGDVLRIMQRHIDKFAGPLKLQYSPSRKRVRMKMYANNDTGASDVCLLKLNDNMIRFLGFTPITIHDDTFVFSGRQSLKEAEYEPNINAFSPQCIIVTCDIVQDTIFGCERLNLLRLVTNKMIDVRYDTIHYEFLQDEFVDLSTHEFDRVSIRICDVTGSLLHIDENEIETRLQLEFKEST